MAYQNVVTPRFYIDDISYIKSHGIFELQQGSDVFDSNPSNIYSFTLSSSQSLFRRFKRYNISDDARPNYFAILGHNLASQKMGVRHSYYNTLTGGWNGGHTQSNIVNGSGGQMDLNSDGNGHGTFLQPDYDGFSIVGMTNSSDDGNYLYSGFNFEQDFHYESEKTLKFGAIIYGRYYDMPNAPNLSLTMSRDYGGTKEFTTYNGSSMSNTMWSKPPKWGDRGAWELGDSNPKLSRSGRRVWDLSFSYLQDSDVFGSNQSLSNLHPSAEDYRPIYNSTGYEDSDIHFTESGLSHLGFNYNILTDDSFFSQVWHKTLGGTLPFIFQPDSSNNNPDQFCIARFKNNSLKATQSSFNVYDISLSIEEVW
tara:strand:- start:346 stop:1443 length:1098 start_codon:yes stop_codon:yes gene_type:complete